MTIEGKERRLPAAVATPWRDPVTQGGTVSVGVARPVVAFSAAAFLVASLTMVASVAVAAPASSRIAAGEIHTCVVTSTGALKCWGNNTYGQLGNGLTSQVESSPVAVKGLTTGVIAAAAGGRHSCALTSGGAVKCWGQAVNGELGIGTPASPFVSAPVGVWGLTSGVIAIAADDDHRAR